MVKPDFTKIWAGSRVSIPVISSPDYVKGFAAYLGPLPPQTDDHDYIMNLQDLRALWLEQELATKTAAATDTTAGIVQLAVAANYPASSDIDAVTPDYVSSAVAGISSAAVVGTFSNLKASATGLSAVVTITADELIVKNGTSYKTLTSVSVTPSLAASGVNGLDTSTSVANTWYADFVIWGAAVPPAGLFSLSATAPTMPAGYTHKARVGWVRSDGTANKYPLGFTQKGCSVTLLIGSANVLTPPLMASGTSGAFSASTFTSSAVAWANYAPSTSRKMRVGVSANNTGMFIGVASNPNRTGYATANPPELGYNSNAYPLVTFADFQIESSNIYWASAGSAIGYLLSGGWEDNL